MSTLDANTPDGLLIEATLAGRREAFDLIVRRYQRALAFVARGKLGQADLADDVVQDTFLCAVKWLHTYDSRYSFRTWLWTILINQCSRAAHKVGRQRSLLAGQCRDAASRSPSEQCISSEASPLERILARESAQRLHELLARLPETQADALRLRFFGGLKFQEIAAAQECSLTSAKARVRAGLIQLSQWLGASEPIAAASGVSP